jgi:activator of HSP90 ATPase
VIAGVAVACVGLAVRSMAWGSDPQSAGEAHGTGVEGLLTYLHQEIDAKATAQRIYEALLDSKQFAAFTGMPAEIESKVGGALSMFGGLIMGRKVELIPNHRIVQAWRPASWEPGVYSIVKFELKGQASKTTVVLDHTGFPEGDFRHLDSGWYVRYWEPLKKFLA